MSTTMNDYVRNYPNSLDLETFEHAGDSYTTTMRFYAHSEFSVSIVVACHGLSFVVYQKRDKKKTRHTPASNGMFSMEDHQSTSLSIWATSVSVAYASYRSATFICVVPNFGCSVKWRYFRWSATHFYICSVRIGFRLFGWISDYVCWNMYDRSHELFHTDYWHSDQS